MKKETQLKIQSCKALQGVSMAEVVASNRYLDNLAAYITVQREDRKAARKAYESIKRLGNRKYKLPSHTIDKLVNLTTEEFAKEYILVIYHQSNRPQSERRYIQQLGQQAYNLTVAQYVVEEFPELHDYFFPKSETN